MTIHWTAAALQPDPHDIAPLHGLVPDAIGAGAPAGHFRNPIFAGHAPDPTVGRDPRTGTFYIYVTHNQASPGPDPIGGTYLRVPVLETRDFNVMVPRGDAMPARPAWVSTEPLHECLWAPHVVPPCAPGDQWLLYFSGLDRRSGQHGIGVAVADDPLGPFTPQPEPLVTGPGYTVIDPFTYRAPDGAAWLYWGSHHAPIRAQQLTADGLALTGEVRDVLHPADRYDGHMRLVEAFSLVRRGDTFFARFSGENT
ncbi:MAG: glycoside hydrolase, partial [Thermoleophilia bacterium]|nr:glycoside hydrolase [Thermoleophilia bacterium]